MKIYIGKDGDGTVWIFPRTKPRENGGWGEDFSWIPEVDKNASCVRIFGSGLFCSYFLDDIPCELNPGQYVECEVVPGQIYETDLVKRETLDVRA